MCAQIHNTRANINLRWDVGTLGGEGGEEGGRRLINLRRRANRRITISPEIHLYIVHSRQVKDCENCLLLFLGLAKSRSPRFCLRSPHRSREATRSQLLYYIKRNEGRKKREGFLIYRAVWQFFLLYDWPSVQVDRWCALARDSVTVAIFPDVSRSVTIVGTSRFGLPVEELILQHGKEKERRPLSTCLDVSPRSDIHTRWYRRSRDVSNAKSRRNCPVLEMRAFERKASFDSSQTYSSVILFSHRKSLLRLRIYKIFIYIYK